MTEGFAIVPNWLIRDSEVSIYVIAVYAALSSRADRAGVCWPSIATIAKEARCADSTVKKALDELRGLGLLEWSRRFDGDRSLSNLYRLNLSVTTSDGGGRTTAPSFGGEGVGRATGREGPHHGYEEESPKKNQNKKTHSKVHRRGARATEDQIRFRQDCHILLHGELPTEADKADWAGMSRGEIDEEIRDYWSEIAPTAPEDLPLGDEARAALSPRALAYLERMHVPAVKGW